MAEASKRHHVVLFPFMAQGHITPFLALANLLALRPPNLTITLVSTPLNIQNIRASTSPLSSIRLRVLPFGTAAHEAVTRVGDGYDPVCLSTRGELGVCGAAVACTQNVCTASLPTSITSLPSPNLRKPSSWSLQPAFEQLIDDIAQEDGRPPLCIITDYFQTWTAAVAHRHGSFHSTFLTGGAFGMAVFFSLWIHLHHTQNDAFPLPEFTEIIIHRSQLPKNMLEVDSTHPLVVYMLRQFDLLSETDAILVNTVAEIEPAGLGMLHKLYLKPTWTIGPLMIASPAIATGHEDEHVKEWLDSQQPASVLYVSLGSHNSITVAQMMELAAGLEASEAKFIWAVRPPVEVEADGLWAEWLPEKFEERMREQGRGLLVRGWVPQLEILSHTATGALLSHCGWNSALESLSRGVPILAWPLTADQPYNAKMLEGMGVCVVVAAWGNTAEGSRVHRGKVERVVREVMGEGERAREMRRRVEEVRVLMEAAVTADAGSSFMGLNEFFQAAYKNFPAENAKFDETVGQSESFV